MELFVDFGYTWTSREMANLAKSYLRAHGIIAHTERIDGGGWGLFESKSDGARMVSTESLLPGSEIQFRPEFLNRSEVTI